mmetsp:Transcript_43999/g.82212  ORF Transcript_43999/g.82212 Transcript_43999/m.82212 type:complete len:222 (+) Transcript_43999:43-708(+)
MQIDYSRFDHIDTSGSENEVPAQSQPAENVNVTSSAPANVLDDLEDYFHRLDARGQEGAQGDEDRSRLPSVERFDADDFRELKRCRLKESMECAICLADLLPEEEAIQLPCAARHTFHAECLQSWLSRNVTCPLCRVDVRALVRHHARVEAPSAASGSQDSPRAFGYTRDGGVILRYDPRPPPELPRPMYIPRDLHHQAELVEIEYPDRGTARVWRVPRNR